MGKGNVLLVVALLVGSWAPAVLLSQEGDQDSRSFETTIEAAAEAYEEGDLAEAEELYRTALEEDPENAAIYYNLGNIHYDRGEYGRAIAAYENAVDRGGRDLRLFYNLGNAYYGHGNFDAALEAYRDARAAGDGEGSDGALTVNSAKTLLQLGRTAEARELLQGQVEENSEDSRGWFYLGNIAYEGEDYEAAAGHFRRAVELEAGLIQGHFNLGNTLFRLEEYRGAAEAFNEVVSRRPNDTDAIYNLGLSYIRLAENLSSSEEE